MTPRIEWAEPPAVTAQRREAGRAQNRRLASITTRAALLLSVPATLFALLQAPANPAAIYFAVLALAILPVFIWSLFLLLFRPPIAVRCTLDERGFGTAAPFPLPWSQARAFDIADHPALPGVRRLTIHRRGLSPQHLDFQAGQLDEAEVSAFVQSRIAPQLESEILRRVRVTQ